MMLSKRINKDRLAMYRLLSRVFLREADTALMTGLRKLAFPKLDDGSLLQTG